MTIQQILSLFTRFDPIWIVEHYKYKALFVLILIEEAGAPLPVPGDALIAFFGVLSRKNQVTFGLTLATTVIASILGASLLYLICRRLGRPLIDQYGHYLHISHAQIDNMQGWMGRYGAYAMIIARLTPFLRIIGTVAAGILEMPYKTFILSNIVGTILWTSLYYGLGAFLGKRYGELIDQILTHHFLILGGSIGFFGLWVFALRKYTSRKTTPPLVNHEVRLKKISAEK
jgi:membrane protein DedA with SNARE-associated domain